MLMMMMMMMMMMTPALWLILKTLFYLVLCLHILNVFKTFFNYGQLLVHARALLSSQNACVICFIKLLVTNRD